MIDCSSKQLNNDASKAIKNNSAIGYKLDDRSDDFEMHSVSKYDSRSEGIYLFIIANIYSL